MTQVAPSVLSAVFRLAGRSRSAALVDRLPAETRHLLRSPHDHGALLPGYLVEQLIAAGYRDLLIGLAGHVPVAGPDPKQPGADGPYPLYRTMLRLAAAGDPEIGRVLYCVRYENWTVGRELRAAVLAAADPADPGWRGPDGLVTDLFAVTSLEPLLPTLRGPFPDLVRHTVENFGELLDVSEQLDGALAVLAAGGVSELGRLAGLRKLADPVAEAVGRAMSAPDPAAVLVAAYPPPDRDLHRRLRRQDPGVLPRLRAGVDWTGLLAEHQRAELPERALEWLVTVPGCPEELLVAAVRGSVYDLAEIAGPLPWAVLTSDWSAADSIPWLTELLGRGIPAGWFSVERVLAEVRPARQVLTALPYSNERVCRSLAELVEGLGADFGAWRALFQLLPRFRGSSTELVAEAVAKSARHRGESWPKSLAQEVPAPPPTGARAVFLRLLSHATPAVQRSVQPHLDDRAVQQWLGGYDVPDEVRADVLRTHGVEALYGMAVSRALSIDRIEYLLSFDDPELNAVIYRHARPSPAQRRRILAGERRQGGRTDPLPLSDELIRVLVDNHGDSSQIREWLLPICAAGHPYLSRVLLGLVKLHTSAARLLLLVRLWERAGPDEVRALLAETSFPGRRAATHPLPAETQELVATALAAPDGLDLLRERLAEATSPAGRVRYLRANAGHGQERAIETIDRLREETGLDLPWEELCIAHRADPLPDSLLVVLARDDDCPAQLREAARAAAVRLDHPAWSGRRSGPRPSALDLLKRYPMEKPTGLNVPPWIRIALDEEMLTPLDVLRYGRPAHPAAVVLAHGAASLARSGSPTEWRAARRELRQLTDKHLGADPDVWALAVRLLPEFDGTLPELLATTAAVVS